MANIIHLDENNDYGFRSKAEKILMDWQLLLDVECSESSAVSDMVHVRTRQSRSWRPIIATIWKGLLYISRSINGRDG
jgi:hypothetical protein